MCWPVASDQLSTFFRKMITTFEINIIQLYIFFTELERGLFRPLWWPTSDNYLVKYLTLKYLFPFEKDIISVVIQTKQSCKLTSIKLSLCQETLAGSIQNVNPSHSIRPAIGHWRTVRVNLCVSLCVFSHFVVLSNIHFSCFSVSLFIYLIFI